MNNVLDILYGNQATFISYPDLYRELNHFLSTVKNSELVDIDTLVLCFGTFLETVPNSNSLNTLEWLNVMKNTLNELSLNSYRSCNTIYATNNRTLTCEGCQGCTEWLLCRIGCVSVELSEAGIMYKYPIDKKIDELMNKHFPISSSSSDFLEMSRIYDIISEYFEDHTEQKYTKIYIDSLILGIYISIHACYKNVENNENNIKPFFVKYIKHLLRNERNQRDQIKFIYGLFQ